VTSILLHEYVEQVDKLIDNDRLVEAIEHCRHILYSYPRHIDTYRMMGKALLEKQEYDAATDIFLRILGADPNDFISYVGLSIIFEEASQHDQALWHLERAYEIQPYNVAIQGELRKLYAVQTKTRLGIIPLTRGALARLYMEGELYQQAIAELQQILAEEPSRMDLQVLLAEALWRDDQRIDAEEVCLSILEELPNSIVLNAILAEIWLQTGRIPEAQKYLRRLQGLTQKTQKSLDKESIPGRSFALDGAFSLPEETILNYLQTGSVLPDESDKPAGDWGEEVSFDGMDKDGGAVVLEPESGMHSYDWLADIEELESEGETAVSGEESNDSDWFSQDKAKEALNLSTSELNAEWLADLRGEEDESSFKPLDLEGMIDEPTRNNIGETDWFANEDEIFDGEIAALGLDDGEETAVSPSEEDAADDSLDWLDQLANDDSPLEIDSTSLMADNLLDWAEQEPQEDEPHIVDKPKTPFWLSQMADEELEAVQLNPDEALEWANQPEAATDLSDESEEMPQEASSDLGLEDQANLPDSGELDDADDWLAALTESGIDEDFAWDEDPTDENAAIDLEVESSSDALTALGKSDDWLQSAAADLDKILETGEFDEEEEFPNLNIPELEGDDITDIPDWLDDNNKDHALSEELEAAVSSDNDPQETPQPEKPEFEPTEAAKDEEDGLDWLDDLASEPDTDADALVEPPIETEGMPSWLDDAQEDTAVKVVDEWESAAAEIPDWLQEPIDLTDLDANKANETKEEEADPQGLTNLLSEMDVTDKAVRLDQMDSLFEDWSPEDEDSDGSLTDLLGGFAVEEEETTLDADESPDLPDEGTGLTGLLSTLTFEDDETAVSDDDEDDGLFDSLFEETLEPEGEPDDAIGLADLDVENVSLTEMLSDMTPEEEVASPQDDWLADLSDLSDLADEEAKPALEADSEEEVGLTGMLANLLSDEETEGLVETAVSDADSDDTPLDLESESIDELSLTELLAGIDYAEDTIQSDPVFPELDSEPIEPSLAEMLTEIAGDPDSEEETDDLPISAEDTTWLDQLEADTDSLQEQEDAFDLAEESGLDWLTTPDESVADEAIEQPEAEVEEADEAEPIEPDGTAEDWDDAMSWLEELAAQQDEPVEELPSVAETMLDEELDTAEKLAATTPVDSGSLDWLDELTSGEGDDKSSEASEEILDDETKPELPETDAMVEEDIFAGLGDLDDADEISWLDELATDNLDRSLVEEAETIIDPVEEPAQPAADEPDWLDELAVEDIIDDEPDGEAIAEEVLDFSEMSLPLDESGEIADTDFEEEGLGWLDAIVDETAVDEAEAVAEPEEAEASIDGTPPEIDVVVAGVTDALKMDSGIEEAEADLEEALAWLDDLDDEGELDMLDEVPPTLADLPAPEMAADVPEADDVPETIIIPAEPDELALALDRLTQNVLAEGIDVPDTAVFPITLSSDELSATLDWIEAAEAVEKEPVAETDESVAKTAVVAEDDLNLADMSDDPEAWLEQLLNDDLTMDIEMEPPPIKPSEDAVFVTDDAPAEIVADLQEPVAAIQEDELADVELEGLPDDPDAAIAWLDQMASDDDGSDEPELGALANAIVAQTKDIDLELDNPEAWLEQMLSGDMALDVEMEPPPIKPSEDAVYVTDDTTAVEPKPELMEAATDVAETVAEPESEAEIGMGDLSDDPEAWLEQLLSDDLEIDIEMEPPAIKPSEDAVYVTDDGTPDDVADDDEMLPETTLAPEASLDVSEAVETDIIVDVPDDPDEAMAWLEQLAARQGAAMDELPSVTDAEADPILPSWMEQDLEQAEDVEEVETAVSPDAPDALIEKEAADEDVASELPDWLASEEDEKPIMGETGWLRSLPEIDMDTWLSAEEEATATVSAEEHTIPDTGPLSAPPQTPSTEDLDDDLFEPVLEPSTGAYTVDEAQLSTAQDAMANGRLDDAVSQFKQLVTAGSGMMTIIAELEQAAENNPQKPAFYQVLGDAYMRNGQLQKALTSYRSALDQM
jgi:tetratricopeptide (TPR) repeat protein